MDSLKLKEQRASLLADSRKLIDKADNEQRDLNAEENGEWSKRMLDLDKLDEEIRKLERKELLEQREKEISKAEPRKTTSAAPQYARNITKADRNKALKAWLAFNSPVNIKYDNETYNRCAELGYHLNQCSLNRSLHTTSASTGGDATFTTTFPEVQTEMKYFSPILDKVNVIPTDDGNSFVMPRGTDVANLMSIVSQTSASATNVDPSVDKVTLGSYLFRYVEQVTYEQLQDTVFDIEAWVTARLAERAARTLEKYIVSGTGSSQPTGLITAALAANSSTANVTLASGHSSLYRFEDLFNLFKAVDLAYRPKNTLVLHDSSVWDLRGIKDSQGRYIWDVNNTLVQNSQPDKIAERKERQTN